MELHSCHNCELINDVISNKIKSFDVLTEENLTLHRALINARQSVISLQAEVTNLTAVIAAERQRNLDLHLKQLTKKNNSNVLLSVISETHANNADKQITYTKKVSFQSSKPKTNTSEIVVFDTYHNLMELFKKQTETYQENLNMLQNGSEKYIQKLEEELYKAHDHSFTILDIHAMYRKQLFTQKLKNIHEHQNFLDTVNVLIKVNSKYIAKVEQKVLEEASDIVSEQTRSAFKTLARQLQKRDKLVHILRSQHAKFDIEIERLKNQLTAEQQNAERKNNGLKKLIQNERRKYVALEQRRAFDLEGFQTDIKQFRKQLSNLKDPSNRKKLETEIGHVEDKLLTNYSAIATFNTDK